MKVSKEPRIDLLAYLREEQSQQRDKLRKIAIVVLLTLWFLGGMGSVLWFQNTQIEALQNENKKLQQQINSMNKSVASTDTVLDNKKSSDSRQAMLSKLEAAAQVRSKQLREIYRLCFPDITIGKIEMKTNNELGITGYCNNQVKFIEFLGEIGELDFIKEGKNISSKYNEKTGEVSFNLTLVLEVK